MKLVKVRFQEDLCKLFDNDFNPTTSPVTNLLRSGENVVIDTSLEVHDLNLFRRNLLFSVPVFNILRDCCEVAGVPFERIHWITPVAEFTFSNKLVFNGTFEEYKMSRNGTVGFNSNIQKKFLCLNNYPKKHRRKVVDFLESTGISDDSIYSYNPREVGNDKSIKIDNDFKDLDLPNNLDSLPESVWEKTGISIITESLFSEKIIFPTEKTWKAFDKFHFPIFVSVPGFVSKIRNMGFDVFDDIINHSYDTVQDDNERLAEILKSISAMSRMSISDISYLKKRHKERLYNNQLNLHRLIESEIQHRNNFLLSLF